MHRFGVGAISFLTHSATDLKGILPHIFLVCIILVLWRGIMIVWYKRGAGTHILGVLWNGTASWHMHGTTAQSIPNGMLQLEYDGIIGS